MDDNDFVRLIAPVSQKNEAGGLSLFSSFLVSRFRQKERTINILLISLFQVDSCRSNLSCKKASWYSRKITKLKRRSISFFLIFLALCRRYHEKIKHLLKNFMVRDLKLLNVYINNMFFSVVY